jgi:hypothetical protein
VLLRPEPPRDGEFDGARPALHLRSCDELAMLLSRQHGGEFDDADLIHDPKGPK